MRCVVALGSNLGDRRRAIAAALTALGRLPGTRLVRASRVLETPPEAAGDGGPYLNAAALLDTARPPRRLLADLLGLERRLGRRRDPAGPRARRIDLDLILYEGAPVLREAGPGGLELPHPRFRGRSFVLLPAAEVAPELRDPLTRRTLRELAQAR